MRRSILALFVGVWVLGLCGMATAQTGTSSLVGQVADPSGGVLPGVAVTVVQLGTNFRFEAITNETGFYRIPNLQPGQYRVTFELPGFTRLVGEAIQLSGGDTVRVNGTLEVGAITDDVQVLGKPPLLATETSDTGTVVKGEMLATLPMYQRQSLATLLLVPGSTTRGYAAGGLGSYSVAGQRSSGTAAMIDGMITNDPVGGTGTMRAVQNSISEIKVYTGTLPAEFGHSTGGVVSVVKKTGTNQLHGMGSMFGRVGGMQHRNFFDRDRPRKATFMQPEGYLGGPVILPKIYNGQSKTFFFVSFDRLLDQQTKQFFGTVPTPEMKAGDFSLGGIGNAIYDPATTRQLADGSWTRDPFPGNVIPQDRIDPVARRILEVNPWLSPNLAGAINRDGPANNLLYDRAARAAWLDVSGRIDHQFSPAFTVYGSYTVNEGGGPGWATHMRWAREDPFIDGPAIRDFDGAAGRQSETLAQHFLAGNTWVLGPTLVSSTRVGYARRASDAVPFSWGKNYAQILGIPNISGDMLPAFGTGNQFSPSSAYGLTPTGISRDLGQTYFVQTDLTKVKGSHTVKTGYELLRMTNYSTRANIPSGRFLFDQTTAGLQRDGNPVPNTGNTFAGFLLGYVRQAQFDQELAPWEPHSAVHGLYIQDDWRVASSLTLNLGLRYSNESPYSATRMSNFDPAAIDSLTGRQGGIVHPEGALHKRDNNNFQPRVGLAWHPVQRWAFRAGFGLNTVDVNFPLSRGNFDEYVAEANLQRAPGDPRPLFRVSEGAPPIQFNTRPDGTAAFLGVNFGARNVEWWDPNLQNPTVKNWNVSVQFEAADNYLLEFMYQGAAGSGLIERWEINTFPVDFGKDDPALRAAAFRAPQDFRPYPHFGSIRMRSNFGRSEYHGGTVKLEKRYSHGLSFLTHYTLSRAMNTQDGDNDGTGVAPLENRGLEWGRAGHDRTHVWIGSLTYELPFGQGRAFMNRGGLLNAVLGNWDISWIQTYQSGNPLSFTFAGSPNNYYPDFVGIRRPNLVSTPEVVDDWQDVGNRFDVAAMNPVIGIQHFAYPDAFTAGNAGRNTVTGLPLVWTTASIQKNLTFGPTRLQVRFDMNNPFKTWNFNPPNTVVNLQTPATFGKVTSNPETAGFGGAPLMNLALKLYF
jgi:hypothetical protein